jgi:general secretion pathway protein E
MPAAFLQQAQLLPVAITEQGIVIATSRPFVADAAKALAYQFDRTAILKVATQSELAKRLAEVVAPLVNRTESETPISLETTIAEGDAERLRDMASEAPTIRLLNRIVSAALERQASDIHIEPVEDRVRVRFRIDGALQIADTLERGTQLALISRIKILARLNIAEQRLPQDGRIRLAVRGREVDFRVSTSPTLYGESVVLRILDRKDLALDFSSLGFAPDACAALERLIETPHGIVLVTGPTGSGKTTTLYAALSLLNREDLKVFTVEDPIEYHLKGANQILVRPAIGLDFATVLRSLLRQDPDVMMVGEIRDSETAKIAVQAALTGHMVLSTLHTNSAAASITRLRNIGIEDFLITSTVRAIIAQRLVRKLCPACKAPSKQGGFQATGCPACHGTGYAGRTVISEILELTDAIQSAILRGAPDSEIEQIACAQGMVPVYDCAAQKVADGTTSRDEVARIVTGPPA